MKMKLLLTTLIASLLVSSAVFAQVPPPPPDPAYDVPPRAREPRHRPGPKGDLYRMCRNAGVYLSEEQLTDTYQYVIGYLQARMVMYKGFDYHDLEMLNENLKNAKFKEFVEKLLGDDTVETIHTYAKKDDFSYRPPQLVKK